MQPEDHRTEYKLKLTDQLEKEVVGFLNAREGGLIYIGADRVPIDADGMPVNNVQHLKIIEYLRTHESVTNATAVILLDVKATRVKVILREMVELGLLEARGEKRYRIYVLSTSLSRLLKDEISNAT